MVRMRGGVSVISAQRSFVWRDQAMGFPLRRTVTNGCSQAKARRLMLKPRRRRSPGTLHRDLFRSTESCRDLGCRSGHVSDASAQVEKTYAQDPAYRPTCNNFVLKLDARPSRHVSGAVRSGEADTAVRSPHGTNLMGGLEYSGLLGGAPTVRERTREFHQ
jgi:hypothetical protein